MTPDERLEALEARVAKLEQQFSASLQSCQRMLKQTEDLIDALTILTQPVVIGPT